MNLPRSPKESEDTASSQKIAISSKGLEVNLRRFLADISPGMFLLLIIYLNDQGHDKKIMDLSGDGATSRMIFYFLIAIPAGFIINAAGYFFFFGLIVRGLEGLMLRSDFICGRFVTICDWKEVRDFFKLNNAKRLSDYLFFRYNCESVMASLEPRWYGNFEHVGGIEILSRNVAVLVTTYIIFAYYRDPLNVAVLLGAASVLFFLMLSAFDSLYVGVRCVRYLCVICKYQLGMAGLPWTDVMSLLGRKPAGRARSGARNRNRR